MDQDSVGRGLAQKEFYNLSDQVLAKFKLFQGFEPSTPFPGPPVRQAYLIWAQTDLGTRRALVEANGFPMTDQPILPGEAFVVFGFEAGRPTTIILKNPEWY